MYLFLRDSQSQEYITHSETFTVKYPFIHVKLIYHGIPYLFKKISICDRFIFDLIVHGLLCKSKTPISSCVWALFSLWSMLCFLLPCDLCFCAEKVIPETHVSCLQKGAFVNNSKLVSTQISYTKSFEKNPAPYIKHS